MRESGKKQLTEHALRELRARILSGDIGPDEHISEAAAADLTGTSRTPAREALAQLVEEGLLSRTSSGRCTVRQFTREDITDAIELRGVLEGTVLRLAAERGPEPDVLKQCEDILDRIDIALGADIERLDFEGYAQLNEDFHERLAHVSGSETMKRELMRVLRLPFASPNAFPIRKFNKPAVRISLYRAQEQHRGMLQAIRNGQGTRAEALGREHARLAGANYDAVMYEDRRSIETVPGYAMIVAGEAIPVA
ncbi:FCD domain-containing protein [Pseudoruegeria sp. HB172150]|uniref:GntR family transcriptional regulator n=1 Tax=Pseudoruegeria sp. HB172150 TaxID=2721164 RepID=UPI001551E856